MTDAEIIKALECCREGDCKNCTFDECTTGLLDEGIALSLINRQKAEIERLNEELKIRPPASASFVFKLEEMQEKGEMLAAKWRADVRAEAIKEFAERLKELPECQDDLTVLAVIDDIVKEMVGDVSE